MNANPTSSRPYMPGMGLPSEPPNPAKAVWSTAEEQLAASRNYWIATSGSSSMPHAMPVWGLWHDGALIFGTGRRTHKGRDLAANPAIVVHLESGDNVVIFEGVVEEVAPSDFSSFVDAYEAKYGIRPEPSDEDAYYTVRPRKAFTWTESDFIESAARWAFH